MDFIIDTNAAEDAETFKSAFPVFSSSRYRLESECDDQESENGNKSEDEYFGKNQEFQLFALVLIITIFQVYRLPQFASEML